jgi:hypothetical protein
MFATVYLRGSKEDFYSKGEELGLKGEALENFTYSCYEVKIGLDVEEKTGFSKIVSIDDRILAA